MKSCYIDYEKAAGMHVVTLRELVPKRQQNGVVMVTFTDLGYIDSFYLSNELSKLHSYSNLVVVAIEMGAYTVPIAALRLPIGASTEGLSCGFLQHHCLGWSQHDGPFLVWHKRIQAEDERKAANHPGSAPPQLQCSPLRFGRSPSERPSSGNPRIGPRGYACAEGRARQFWLCVAVPQVLHL